jgi:hypothetical protein
MTDSPSHFQFTGVAVVKGTWSGDPTPRWFVLGYINDGSEIVLEMKLSEREAIIAAVEAAKEFDVPRLAAAA